MDGKGEWIAMGYKELIYILKYAEVSPDVDRYLDSYLNWTLLALLHPSL